MRTKRPKATDAPKTDPYLDGIMAKIPKSDTPERSDETKLAPAPGEGEEFDAFIKPSGSFLRDFPQTHPGVDRIVEHVYDLNVEDAYKRLESAIRLGNARTEYGSVNEATDDAAANAKLAHRLYLACKLELETWEKDVAIVMAGMRSTAISILEDHKRAKAAAKEPAKQITEADVDSKMAALYPDEFKAHAVKRARLKGLVEHLQNDAEIWKMVRGPATTTMLKAIRR
jgi:hypothetical protein